MSTPRAVPFFCPFCGEEQLRPADPPAGTEGAPWRCESCARVFLVSIVAIGGEG